MLQKLLNKFLWYRAFTSRLRGEGIDEGVLKERKDQRLRQTQNQTLALMRLVGRPLIVVPNEWSNPIIGFGREVQLVSKAQTPILVVADALSGEDRLCMGVHMDFSMQKLDVVLMLDPYQLWAIVAHNAVSNEDFDKPKSGERWSKEEIMARLHKSGFFADWIKYLYREAEKTDCVDVAVSTAQ